MDLQEDNEKRAHVDLLYRDWQESHGHSAGHPAALGTCRPALGRASQAALRGLTPEVVRASADHSLRDAGAGLRAIKIVLHEA